MRMSMFENVCLYKTNNKKKKREEGGKGGGGIYLYLWSIYIGIHVYILYLRVVPIE